MFFKSKIFLFCGDGANFNSFIFVNYSFILSLHSNMMRLRYILAAMLSLLIIYAGAGVSIVHYCCASCETAKACCTTGCPKCQKNHHRSNKSCKKDGCTATIYKVDLMKHSCEASVAASVMQLFCELLPDFQCCLSQNNMHEVSCNVPPSPVSSRYYLTLFSTLLI